MKQLVSTIDEQGQLTLSLREVPVPEPKPGQVLIKVQASPINPSDLGVLFAGADPASIAFGGSSDEPVVTATVPPAALPALKARLGQAVPCGNEGAGIVEAVGDGVDAALVGRTMAILGGACYGEYRAVPESAALLLHEGTSARDGASCFVNPLTALGMVETMRLEGHSALVHTAAASNLGQMLNRICLADDVPLVNVVRKADQAALLKEQGAKYVVNSSDDDFAAKLVDACAETGATLAFDATGGGRLASDILTAMERALSRNATEFSRYGSDVHKQVYIYGGLERRLTELSRTYGMAWGVGGWLLTPFMQRVGPEVVGRLKQRVADELGSTFASHYAREVGLAEALSQDAVSDYVRQATGAKTLICPDR